MYCVSNVTEDFTGSVQMTTGSICLKIFIPFQAGVSYNAYLLLDESTVLYLTPSIGRPAASSLKNMDYLLEGKPA